MRRVIKKVWSDWLKPVLPLIILLLCFRSAIADWNDVPTGSMRPTIVEGDRIFVNKVAYSLRVPFTSWRIAEWDQPARGDIVVLFSPEDGTRLVKRVVGMPGDRIAVRGRVLSINGELARYVVIKESELNAMGAAQRPGRRSFRESVAGRERIVTFSTTPAYSGFAEIVVPDGHYFVMGDNRDNSLDSRWFGPVRREAVVGQATRVVLSVDRERYLAPRFERFLRPLE